MGQEDEGGKRDEWEKSVALIHDTHTRRYHDETHLFNQNMLVKKVLKDSIPVRGVLSFLIFTTLKGIVTMQPSLLVRKEALPLDSHSV